MIELWDIKSMYVCMCVWICASVFMRVSSPPICTTEGELQLSLSLAKIVFAAHQTNTFFLWKTGLIFWDKTFTSVHYRKNMKKTQSDKYEFDVL